jgi:hypothetical protein
VSEWLLFQSLLPGINSPAKLVAPLTTLAIGVLALIGGLAAAGFVKAFGITFLAIPRSDAALHAHESPAAMRLSMGLLAAACVGLALAVVPVLPALSRVLSMHPAVAAAWAPASRMGVTLSVSAGFAQMSPPMIAAGLLLAIGAAWIGARIVGAGRRIRVGETWGCGRVVQTPRMEYTSTAFAEPLRRVFAELYRPTQDLSIDFHPHSKYFVQSIEYRSDIMPWFDRYVYAPAIARLKRVAARVRALQSGSAHTYLTYLVVALLGLLTLLLVRQA